MEKMKVSSGAPDLDKVMTNMFNREYFKYVASKHIFCPRCNQILDYKTVVIIDVTKKDKAVGQAVACTHCFVSEKVNDTAKKLGVEIEITKYN